MGSSKEVRTLRTDHAKSLARWRFHDPPTLDLSDSPCSQGFESADFRFDVVGLDIEMNAARVLYRLDQDLDLVIRAFELPVARGVGFNEGLDGPAKRRRPEAGSALEVLRSAVDDDCSQAAPVHGATFAVSEG